MKNSMILPELVIRDDILAPHSLDHMMIVNERHLRAVLREYVTH